jgi:putative acetyltransferase
LTGDVRAFNNSGELYGSESLSVPLWDNCLPPLQNSGTRIGSGACGIAGFGGIIAKQASPSSHAQVNMSFSVRVARSEDVPAIRAVLLAVRSEYGVHSETGVNDADLDDLLRNYFQGGGCFEVVEDAAGQIVGCAGLHPLNPCRAELCKMYIQKCARGQGFGRRMLDDLLEAARKGGFQEVWLKTNSVLAEAISLYAKYGFQPVDAEHLSPRCDAAYLLRLDNRPVA